MTDVSFLSAVVQMRKMAEQRDLVFLSNLRSGASEAEVLEVEMFIGAHLPESLGAFLRLHNGFALSLGRKSTDDPSHLVNVSELHVFGAAEIIKATSDLRGYLDGIDVEAIGEEAGLTNVRERSGRCIALASIGQGWRAAFSLDEPRELGEYAVVKVDVETMHWLARLEKGVSHIEIAASVNAFLERSLEHMLENGQRFDYWSHANCTSS